MARGGGESDMIAAASGGDGWHGAGRRRARSGSSALLGARRLGVSRLAGYLHFKFPASDLATHSLKIGGATALFGAGVPVKEVL